jgi:hypothetical protein
VRFSPKFLATLALGGALILTVDACSSSSFSSPAAPPTTVATDTVTAIPNLTGVGTSVKLDAGTAAALKSLGVSVAPAGTATFDASTSTVTFPITSGYVEIHSDTSFKPGYIVGSIEHDGSGLTLSAGSTSVELDDFVVDPGNSMLYGTVGGKPDVPLLSLDGTNVKVSKDQSGDVVLDGTVAKLTATAAMALDQAFNTTAVKAGLPLGTVHLVAKGTASTYAESTDKTTEISRLNGQSTSVTLNASTAAALKSLNVSVAPTGSATFDASTSTVSFPITGGFAAIHSDVNYKPGYIVGVVLHQASGLMFSSGDKSLTVSDFVVDPGDSILTATVGGKPGIPLLFLDGTAVKVSTDSAGDVVLDGTVARLTATAASALNQTFGVTAFAAGIPLGVVHLVAATS